MGLKQSKEERLYKEASYGNIQSIKFLHSRGAGLEWIDKDGKTPLMLASMDPKVYDVAKTLIELGANVNAYRSGRHAGTPLHHAAKRGLLEMVKLLLSSGADVLVINDDGLSALDVARVNGYSNVVRAIEEHSCFFSGWLLELHESVSQEVWVVILPSATRKLARTFKLELAIYPGLQFAKPRTIIELWNANMDERNFDQADPAVVFSSSDKSLTKLGPVNESGKKQFQRFCNACKGILQTTPADHELTSAVNKIVPSAPPLPDMMDFSSLCVICLDAPVEGACIPCGHMAGCMSCLNEIKSKKWDCPACRAKINQVVRLYAV
uniref:putative E3 ubiquitin-protein ligase XBAT35 n=1 Tax=Erigeron canadensis TaxID=72917 RepID=UPI001CB94D10|nr:putative E3 ubiquitin-protein ligase XBAT35 [Erigeron canadensis]